MRCLPTLTLALGLLISTPALGDDPVPPTNPFAPTSPTFSFVGSFSPSYTDNALFTRHDRRSDVYAEPDLSLRLDGTLSPDLSYRLYMRTSFDAFADVTEANESFLIFGGRITWNVFDWRAIFFYENRTTFDGLYGDRLFTANDLNGALGRDFDIGKLTLSPLFLLQYRFSDLPEARRYRFDIVLGIEYRLNETWAIVSTPFFEAYWFTDGANSGRRDQIYSASLGLRYRIADNASLTASVIYEARRSNRSERRYNMLEIGPRLDFIF